MTQESSVSQTSRMKSLALNQMAYVVPSLLGSVFLALMAQFSIPLFFTPVPVTLQTLGVAILAMVLGPRQAACAVILYLVQATWGLPVLAGGLSNPFWIIGPRAGYLFAFVGTAYLVAKLLSKQQNPSFLKSWLIFALNEGIVLFFGSYWLALFVGWENALYMGMLPFLPGAIAKITIASMLFKSMDWVRSKV